MPCVAARLRSSALRSLPNSGRAPGLPPVLTLWIATAHRPALCRPLGSTTILRLRLPRRRLAGPWPGSTPDGHLSRPLPCCPCLNWLVLRCVVALKPAITPVQSLEGDVDQTAPEAKKHSGSSCHAP